MSWRSFGAPAGSSEFGLGVEGHEPAVHAEGGAVALVVALDAVGRHDPGGGVGHPVVDEHVGAGVRVSAYFLQLVALVSLGTIVVALDQKATKRPSALIVESAPTTVAPLVPVSLGAAALDACLVELAGRALDVLDVDIDVAAGVAGAEVG